MVEKDYERAKRLNEVYKHLFCNCNHGINSQTAMADYLGVSRTGLSAAFNGNKRNLTDNLFKKICAAFPGVFNVNYLLHGKGELLADARPLEKLPRPEGVQLNSIKEIKDTRTLFNLAMELIKENENLHRQLLTSIAEIRTMVEKLASIPTYENYGDYPTMVAEDKHKKQSKRK